jgi:eukaryotic-like serine/threonine-protein kinase
VLEYIRGECIDRYCEARDLSIEQRITLFLDVLAAVAHAHSNLIIHRDLKPANILVSEDGAVKLLDFGVASLLSSPTDGEDAPPTGHVATGLTPGYAAPEQLRDAAVTTTTDVYSLGLVLFVLLAGRHPLSPTRNTPAELVRLTLETEVPHCARIRQIAIHPSIRSRRTCVVTCRSSPCWRVRSNRSFKGRSPV